MPDPIEAAMEAALSPGYYISEAASWTFTGGLEKVRERIGALTGSEPERAVGLYETFVAACYEKADEVDDSSGDYGSFGGSLFCSWVTARQAAGGAPLETVDRLLAWMVHDQYGFWHGLEEDLASVLDAAGRQACIARIKQTLGSGDDSQARAAYHRVQLDRLLRAIYVAQRDTGAYLALAEEAGITAEDCVAVASMFAAEQENDRALEWAERGLELDAAEHPGSFAGHDLRDLQRVLLARLGRHDEAVRAVWADFERSPSTYAYEALMEFVPEAERPDWHAKAIEAAAGASSLHGAVPLLVESKETAHLARLIERRTDEDLEHGSSSISRAAQALAEDYPRQAARLWRAMGVGIVNRGKSKYYGAALDHFERAKRCYAAAGLEGDWEELVDWVRANHSRKRGFMAGFEEVAAGTEPEPEPSFLEQAKARWTPPLDSPS
ncbi:MAG: DUF6880 family protein [Trebonia sp.]